MAGSVDLPSQLLAFENDHPMPAANALYTLSVGANDLLDAISVSAADPGLARQDVQAAVTNEAQFIQGLIDFGATTFDVLNATDFGKIPLEAGTTKAAAATSLSAQYDSALSTTLAQLASQEHVTIHLIDVFGLVDQVVADPAAFGFSNATDPVWTGNAHDASSGTLSAHGAAENQYLFFDHLHPTAAGHGIIANAAFSALGTHA